MPGFLGSLGRCLYGFLQCQRSTADLDGIRRNFGGGLGLSRRLTAGRGLCLRPSWGYVAGCQLGLSRTAGSGIYRINHLGGPLGLNQLIGATGKKH